MGKSPWSLTVDVGVAEDADPEEADETIRALRAELLELDVDTVGRAMLEQPPAGARGLSDGAGALIVELSDSAALVALVSVLRSWLGRDRGRKVTIRLGEDCLEIDRASAQEQAKLIEAWLEHRERC